MKVVIPGGSGHLGRVLAPAFRDRGHRVVVLTRGSPDEADLVSWDGRSLGPWAAEIDGADAVINLAGRSVNCRYTRKNLLQMLASRVDSTRVVGQAIEQAACPPRVWLQMSTATIYAHRFDAPNDEATGRIGGAEPDAPLLWRWSVCIALAWEEAQACAHTPCTRRVALRSAMVMSPHHGGVLDMLLRLTRLGLGGSIAGGRQFVSWIHDRDFVRAIEVLLECSDIDGPVILAAPHPLPQRELMNVLRSELGVKLGLPVTRRMAEVGALALQTETELVLKSRRVAPTRLLNSGFAPYPRTTIASESTCVRATGQRTSCSTPGTASSSRRLLSSPRSTTRRHFSHGDPSAIQPATRPIVWTVSSCARPTGPSSPSRFGRSVRPTTTIPRAFPGAASRWTAHSSSGTSHTSGASCRVCSQLTLDAQCDALAAA